MSLSFKKATEKDIPIISDLAYRIWKIHYASINSKEQNDYMLEKIYSPNALRQQMQEQQQYSVIYDNDKPTGYMSVSTKDQKNYFLHKLYVEVTEHRKGIGVQALKYILETFPSLETMELTVNRQNYKAINFYFKHGFVIKEVADFPVGNNYFMYDFVMIATVERLRSGLKQSELAHVK